MPIDRLVITSSSLAFCRPPLLGGDQVSACVESDGPGSEGPYGAGDFGCACHDYLVDVHPATQGIDPLPEAIARPIEMGYARACTTDKQASDTSIAALADAEQRRPASCRMLLRHQSWPGSKVASSPELPAIPYYREQRCRCLRTDARDSQKGLGAFFAGGDLLDLFGKLIR